MPEYANPANLPPNPFTSVSDWYLVPYDPQNDRILQFEALRTLGYPVGLRRMLFGEIQDSLALQPRSPMLRWQRGFYPMWARPVVMDPALAPLIEHPESPGDVFNANNQALQPRISDEDAFRIARHGIVLNSLIDSADVNALAAHIELHREGDTDHRIMWSERLLANQPAVTEESILLRAFATGMVRYRRLRVLGHPFPADGISQRVQALAEEIREPRVAPLSFEAQRSLSADYYQLIASAWPKLLEYRNKQ